MARRVCLFSHFDRDARVSPHVYAYLRELKDCGFETTLVATSASMEDSDKALLLELCSRVYRKANAGLDFGSWSYALRLHPDVVEADEVLLANDSVYGPLGSIADLLSSRRDIVDVRGMTDSYEYTWHLQSYFLLFESARARRELLPQLLSPDFEKMTKPEIIENGELGLGRLVRAGGYEGRAFFPYETLDVGEYLRPRNPTHFFWRELVARGYPFFKIELLRDNPLRRDITGWEGLVTRPELRAAILDHLARVRAQPHANNMKDAVAAIDQRFRRTLHRGFDALPGISKLIWAVRGQLW